MDWPPSTPTPEPSPSCRPDLDLNPLEIEGIGVDMVQRA
jgi:hypothetical protein